MTLDPAALPPLRTVIARHGLAARKGLGQHFLLDGNVTGRIARAAGDLSGVGVVEIGPGPGGLTRALLATPAREVVAVERDRRCVAALAELAEAAGERLRVVEADAVGLDATALTAAPRAIVANLPYNVGTPLLIGWLRQMAADGPPAWQSLTLMFQKEVADRLVARPGTKAYGRLAVIAQWAATVEPLFTLPARAFTPPPKVDSTVVRLTPRPEREPVAFDALERVTAAAFGQRRKMLRQSLKPLGDAEALCAAAGLDPTTRAETVDGAGFVRLARIHAAPPPG
jgi:16S rRNA (adenine1518-N6/adenine1519-N6)-dimethyltransferase